MVPTSNKLELCILDDMTANKEAFQDPGFVVDVGLQPESSHTALRGAKATT